MIGTVWASVLLVTGLLTVALAIVVGNQDGWIIAGGCFAFMGAASLWHGGRFSRMRRP